MKDFQELYKKYNQEIFHYLLRWTNGRKDLAEELVQETFYQVYVSLVRFRGNSSIRTWIYQIAKNVACKYYEKNPIWKSLESDLEIEGLANNGKTMEQGLIEKEERELLQKAIMELPDKYRDVMIYRIYYELSYEKVAETMDISVPSAKVLFHRAKKKIQDMLVR